MLDDDKTTQEFLKEYNLRPKGIELPAEIGPGHPVVGEYFGICSELVPPFNPTKPDCRGKVTTKTRKSKKNDRDVLYYYHCGTCRKEISMNTKLYGYTQSTANNATNQPSQPRMKQTTFLAFVDKLGRPHTQTTPRELLYTLYARNWTYKDTRFLSHDEFSLAKSTLIDWGHYVRRIINHHRRYQSKIGGQGVIVQIDESLFRGKRKNQTGRLLLGDQGRDARRRNYGNRVDGPWIVGMIDASHRVRLFLVRNRSAEVLIPLIRAIVKPGSIIHTDGWAAYAGLGRGAWDDGQAPYQHAVVNHSEEFVAANGAHTQTIERVWTDVKINFIKVKRSTSKELFHEWIGYYEWMLNTAYDRRFRTLAYLVGMIYNE
jgi:hypothetical protein